MFPPEIPSAQKVIKVCTLNLSIPWAINKLQICVIDIWSSKLYFWKLQILTIPQVFADQKNPPLCKDTHFQRLQFFQTFKKPWKLGVFQLHCYGVVVKRKIERQKSIFCYVFQIFCRLRRQNIWNPP